jgi:polyisoprenoid-binding protein YceI
MNTNTLELVSTYSIETEKSRLVWKGKKVIGSGHTGTIKLSEGTLKTEGDTLTGGEFELDMLSITCTDIPDAQTNARLMGHLNSDDFFATYQFTTARFVMDTVVARGEDQYEIAGNLTIKGITHPVRFYAVVSITPKQLFAEAKIVVDRTLYGIRYGSTSFFGNLGDKAISNTFQLEVALVARA